eukprot:3511997-Pyramimonas_sp.AAC.1
MVPSRRHHVDLHHYCHSMKHCHHVDLRYITDLRHITATCTMWAFTITLPPCGLTLYHCHMHHVDFHRRQGDALNALRAEPTPKEML